MDGKIGIRMARSLSLIVVAILLSGTVNNQAWGSKKDLGVDVPAVQEDTGGAIVFGHIPESSPEIVLLVESARVVVKRVAGAGDIVVASNCPHNWNVSAAVVRQAGFSKPRTGVSMMSDALGSRAIVNGLIYPLPTGPIHGLSMSKDGVVVGGQKVDPIAGSTVAGTTGSSDLVEVRVPESYGGGLRLGCAGASEVVVDSWKGGNVECTLLGESSLSAGKLKSLQKAQVDMRGKGKAEIGTLSTKVFVANIAGSGSIVVNGGQADISNATVSGDGVMTLKGNFKNLKKSIEGTGSINVTQ